MDWYEKWILVLSFIIAWYIIERNINKLKDRIYDLEKENINLRDKNNHNLKLVMKDIWWNENKIDETLFKEN